MIDNSDIIPFEAIDFCLNKAGIKFRDVDLIGYTLDPYSRFVRNVEYKSPYSIPNGEWGTRVGELTFYSHNLNVIEALRDKYDSPVARKFFFFEHQLCHAASAFYGSGFDASSVMVTDGIGEFATAWLGSGTRHDGLTCLKKINFPNSLGMFWDRIVEFCGFHYYDSSHLMGLSAYGKRSPFLEKIKHLLMTDDKNLLTVNPKIMRFREERRTPKFSVSKSGFFDYLAEYLGVPPRDPKDEIKQCYRDIAFAAQTILEERLLYIVNWLYNKTRYDNLCYAGGIALNCVANTKIINESPFKKLWVQPAANDAGTSLGAAYLLHHMIVGYSNSQHMNHSYWGPSFEKSDIKKEIVNCGFKFSEFATDDLVFEIATILRSNKIVAWFQGRMEWGPRALGNRSILANPQIGKIHDIINKKIKYREWFRPLCPSVLAEKASEWFDIPKGGEKPAEYMLLACQVKKDKIERIPAVVHVDGSARIQIVRNNVNPLFHKLIKRFDDITGIPLLLNTSFNVREPIVCTPKDALSTFKNSSMDVLCIGPFIIHREGRQ